MTFDSKKVINEESLEQITNTLLAHMRRNQDGEEEAGSNSEYSSSYSEDDDFVIGTIESLKIISRPPSRANSRRSSFDFGGSLRNASSLGNTTISNKRKASRDLELELMEATTTIAKPAVRRRGAICLEEPSESMKLAVHNHEVRSKRIRT